MVSIHVQVKYFIKVLITGWRLDLVPLHSICSEFNVYIYLYI